MQQQLSKAERAELERQLAILRSGAVDIIPEEEFEAKLAESIREQRPLRVKLGLDPSAPDIHLGHTVVIRKLKQFQDLGHQVQLVIGDFTGRIGDPTGRSEVRKQLTEEQIQANARTYVQQYGKILDMERTKLYFNSEWLAPLTFEDVIKLAGAMTLARMLERDDFHKRYTENLPISLHEFFYPLMQGYDSVALETDIELGGTDQTFNLLVGRNLQRERGLAAQVAMTMPLLEGLDGVHKMSKSLGNYIGIDEAPEQMYGKTMSVPDELMLRYYELVTGIGPEKLAELRAGLEDGSVHPRDAKMQLAHKIVSMYHGPQAAAEAEQHFRTVFQQGALPEDIPERVWAGEPTANIIDLLHKAKLVPSRSEARRMVEQGAVRVNEERVSDSQQDFAVGEGLIIQVGKRKFVRLVQEK
ncbi:MAG TPA: tyrosine--tRNA ligase [Firmicutes bacterium]|nr:tyrosine--tRNA ligase [Bacillota bacterium]